MQPACHRYAFGSGAHGAPYATPDFDSRDGTAMTDTNNKVECAEHGSCEAAFVCQHLAQGEGLGFHVGYSEDEPDELYPDAFCDACLAFYQAEGEWNDAAEAYADIKLVCSGCYADIRARNWTQGFDELNDLITESFAYLSAAQERFMQDFDVGKHDRWDWYQETGKLVFSNNGVPTVEADIDFVGSLSTSSYTWMWAWANTSFLDGIKARSREIRALGDANDYLPLAAAIWPAGQEDGWEMTAVMAKQIGAIGAYRTPSDSGFVYMVVSAARWLKPA